MRKKYPDLPAHKTYTKKFPIGKVLAWSGNPAPRTSERALKLLAEDIAKFGVLESPHGILLPDGSLLLGDGHRRTESARLAGCTELMCVVHELDPSFIAALFSKLNAFTRPVTAFEWMSAWHHDQTVIVPNNYMRNIEKCMVFFGGREGIKMLIDTGTAPGIAPFIELVRAKFDVAPSVSKPSARDAGLWMIKHNQQKVIKDLCTPKDRKVPAKVISKIAKAIAGDRPLKEVKIRTKVKQNTTQLRLVSNE